MATRKGWSEGEDVELMAQASSLWERGMLKKDLYARIHSLCPHRSVDSIKKMPQHRKWEPPNPSVMRELPLVLVGEHTCGIAGSDGRQIEQKDKVQGKGPRT
ncbi:hypothetical protein ABG768_008249 [Culter alburnus]|uniref:Uncharacterized protein n=1 Tax=Culter alburnus TaxID=194366 RepID=A0AAW1ZJ26_CULAL